ncbi:hypothetical protein BKA67DRAFT_576115 [Truncatella angustata]|uniref:C2H2-type domain-containing protein n=1 Tax=Truncatella angustata TaxID=152316 RepID=A0A9P8ZU23_9PEZI|nr:uncharacterized protein BKA67DRAFT_576115 [Truncatella angustata]KAH6648876.1 hypothetical protein BKA67DRAFT_576115 [Truncatella angustata]
MPRVHTCPHCSRSFKRPEHLRRHCRTHTGEKPYVCHCGACFSRNDLLRRHENLAHSNDSEHNTILSRKTGFVDLPAIVECDDQACTDIGQQTVEGLSASVSLQTSSENCMQDRVYADQLGGHVVEDLDFASSRIDFEKLTRSVGLHIDWFESSLFEPVDLDVQQEHMILGREDLQVDMASAAERKSDGPIPFAPRLVGYSKDTGINQVQSVRQDSNTSPLTMTEECLSNLRSGLQQLKGGLADMSLPSCHTFTKCLSAWEETLASHLPYIHIPTLCLNNCIPELVLALAALGAQQRYETKTSMLLYNAGKTVALQRIHLTRLRKSEGISASGFHPPGSIIQSASALLTLMIFATWSANAKLVEEAFEFHSSLMYCLRGDGLTDEDETSYQDWYSWALSETRIRVKLMAFCFLNLHTIAYDHPPVLFWHDVDLKLPCTVREWYATEDIYWVLARQEVLNEQRRFPESLKALLSSDGQASQIQPAPSPFGNYVLLQGLLQRIYLVRQLAITPNLPEEDIVKLHKALLNWATIWDRTSESSLNPRDENGPIAFTSVALLGLAHVRVHLNIGPYRDLASRLPAQVAAALANVPSPHLQQTNSAVSALLYSIHALSIPVAIGIEYVVHSQAIFWCCQHSLASLESAVFLSKWLYAISATKLLPSMTRSEKYILHCLRQVLTEAVASADWGDTNTSMWLEDAFHMGLAVLRIWSRVFSNGSAWPITVTIGKSLAIYADAYEKHALNV